MQEVLEELVQRIAADNPDMIEILEEIQRKKRDKVIGKLSSTDAESIFNVIESDNPLSSE
jgi:Mg/Co/Ni transporter MgtE